MDDKTIYKMIVKQQAQTWLKQNPLLLNSEEKQKFLLGLEEYFDDSSITIDDEVYDFLVQCHLVKNEPREDIFMRYLLAKYVSFRGKHVLDVGAGRVCALSNVLAKKGAKVTAMDTNIRQDSKILQKVKITGIKKLFVCDEFSKTGTGTNIQRFDLIVGQEPCDATEHIIRQALKYNKPFDISLCASPHKSLDGRTFETYEQWYEHLAGISNEVSITKKDCGFVATNCDGFER